MKIRTDFVTNSSSSSFIIRNKTDKNLSGKEIALEMKEKWEKFRTNPWYRRKLESMTFDDLLEAAETKLPELKANAEEVLICGDSLTDDGPFECLVHDAVNNIEKFDSFEIEFEESYH